ncbi:ComEA family DNA-binding protein [Rothia sp. ARF10]|nr:ComEA family DNA-binding protein [Rothia sp. ARF10]
MPSRHRPEAVSPRALARVRSAGLTSRGGMVRGGPEADAAPEGGGSGGEPVDHDATTGRHRPVEIARPPVFELPSSLRGARWAPSRSAAVAVLVVIVLVVLVFGLRVWFAGAGGGTPVGARADADPSGVSRGTSTLSRASPTGGATPMGATDAGAARASAGASAVLVVHVVGQVRRPGVYRMPTGARVGEAVAAAGGATPTADLAAVNLARVLVDGEQVHVPRPGESVPAAGAAGGGNGSSSGGAGSGDGSGAPGGPGGKVSLNSADLAALDTLPGVGPVLAQRILDWRTEHGRFTSVEELGEVSGIGEKLLAQLTPKVTL